MTETTTGSEAETVFPPRTVEAFRLVLGLVQEENPQFDPSLVLDMATSMALRRATLLGREVVPLDVEFSLSVLCWWPLKPPPAQEFQERVHSRLQPAVENRDVYLLEQTIGEMTLMLSPENLYRLQEEGRDDLLLRPY
jgi:hypothetical protein